MKRTDQNNKPYINAAIFFAFLLAAFVLFAITVPKSAPEGFGTGDGNGPHYFGSGSGNGTGDGHGDGSMSGNTPKSLANAGKGENPDAKNTEYNPGKGDGKGDGNPPPPPAPAENKKNDTPQPPPEQKQGNQQTPQKINNPNLPIAKLYLNENKDANNQRFVKKPPQTADKTPQKTSPPQPAFSDAGRGTGGGSRTFSASSGGKSVFRIQKNKNILFIVDISGSMSTPTAEGQTRLEILQFQLKRTIYDQNRIRSRGKYNIIAFSDKLYYFPEKGGQAKFSYSHDLSSMENWVNSFNNFSRSATYLFTAIQTALSRIRQQGLEIDTILILTDGEPNDEDDPKMYMKLLKENLPQGIVINTISIGRTSDLLKEIAKNNKGVYDEYK